MPRKGKSASPGGRTHLSAEEEAERKAKQRELQLAAVAARQNGEVFINPEKKKRKPKEARRLAERKMKRKQESAAARRAVQKEVKKARAAAPDVVIVPIFWKGESQQMARVAVAHTFGEPTLEFGQLTDVERTYAEEFRSVYDNDEWLFGKSERNRFRADTQPDDTVGYGREKAVGGMLWATLVVRNGKVLHAILNGDC